MNHRIYCIKTALSFRSFIPSALAVLSIAMVGCGPRGESHTLDQVLSDARTEFTAVAGTTVPDEVSTSLKQVAADLDKLAGIGGGGDAKEIAKVVANSIDSLIEKSGITQRAAMTELVNQYRAVGNSTGVSVGAPQLKLLTARTFTLLKSELISTKFGL
jgi:hypothetical protein